MYTNADVCTHARTHARTHTDFVRYEKAIAEWLKKSQNSPKTNLLLPSKQLLPNHALKAIIRDWLQRHPSHASA